MNSQFNATKLKKNFITRKKQVKENDTIVKVDLGISMSKDEILFLTEKIQNESQKLRKLTFLFQT